MPEPFHGVLPALITPFSQDGSAIDTERSPRSSTASPAPASPGSYPAGAPVSSPR